MSLESQIAVFARANTPKVYHLMERVGTRDAYPPEDFPDTTRSLVTARRQLNMLAADYVRRGCIVNWSLEGDAFRAEFEGKFFGSAAIVEVI